VEDCLKAIELTLGSWMLSLELTSLTMEFYGLTMKQLVAYPGAVEAHF
jgi:hypothetical protein